MVPNGWEKTTFGEHIDLLNGFAFKSALYSDDENDIKLLRGDNIEPNKLRWRDVKRWSKTEYESLEKYHLKENDFIIAMDRTWITAGLKVAEVKQEDLPCLLVQRVSRIRSLPTLCQDLIKHHFSSYQFEQYVKSVQTETAVPHISATQIREFGLLLPPLREQQKIAKILSTWDKAISTTERLIDNSTQQKKALMQQLLTGKKRLLDDEGKRFEGEWARQPISFVADVITGNTPSTKNQEYYGGGKLFVSPSDLGISKYILETTKRLTDLGFSQTRKVPKGSSLFTCIGSTIGKLGIAGEELATNQQINSVCAKGNNCGEFIYYQLLFHAEQIKGSAATQAVPIINKTNFESQLIFSPASLEEQQKIATVLTNADKEIELLDQQLADLQQEKKALMQVLLTGKKRVVVD
ncbi:restriction endonuclease subunit S [Psychrobacter sp. 16-Bac2893]